ncbi:hypothetical protein ACLOJK_017322 [Asimina triloba]
MAKLAMIQLQVKLLEVDSETFSRASTSVSILVAEADIEILRRKRRFRRGDSGSKKILGLSSLRKGELEGIRVCLCERPIAEIAIGLEYRIALLFIRIASALGSRERTQENAAEARCTARSY